MDTTYPVLQKRGVFVPKNRVLHARITDDTHEKLTRVCSEMDCSITDYVTSVLDESFDQKPMEIPEPTVEIIPELQNVRIVYD
jgi:hypothetical protein